MEVARVIVGVIFFIILWGNDNNNDIDSGMDLRMKDSTFWEDYDD